MAYSTFNFKRNLFVLLIIMFSRSEHFLLSKSFLFFFCKMPNHWFKANILKNYFLFLLFISSQAIIIYIWLCDWKFNHLTFKCEFLFNILTRLNYVRNSLKDILSTWYITFNSSKMYLLKHWESMSFIVLIIHSKSNQWHLRWTQPRRYPTCVLSFLPWFPCKRGPSSNIACVKPPA